VSLDRAAERGRVEARKHDARGAEERRRHVGGPDAEAERGGQGRQEDVFRPELARLHGQTVEVIPARLIVGDALGKSGRAGGRIEEPQVVRAEAPPADERERRDDRVIGQLAVGHDVNPQRVTGVQQVLGDAGSVQVTELGA